MSSRGWILSIGVTAALTMSLAVVSPVGAGKGGGNKANCDPGPLAGTVVWNTGTVSAALHCPLLVGDLSAAGKNVVPPFRQSTWRPGDPCPVGLGPLREYPSLTNVNKTSRTALAVWPNPSWTAGGGSAAPFSATVRAGLPPGGGGVATLANYNFESWAMESVQVDVSVKDPGTYDATGQCVGRTYVSPAQLRFLGPRPPVIAPPPATVPPVLTGFLSQLEAQLSVTGVGTTPGSGHTYVTIPTCAYVTPAPPSSTYAVTIDEKQSSRTPGVDEVVRYTLTVTPQAVTYEWGDGSPATPGDAGQPGVHPTQYYGNGQWSSECGRDSHVYRQVYGPDVPGRPSVTVSATQDFLVTATWSVSDGYLPQSGTIPGQITLHLTYRSAPPLCVYQIQGVPYTTSSPAPASTSASGPSGC